MAWHTTTDVDDFDAATRDHLVADRARHTLHLTISEVVRRRGAGAFGPVPPWFGWHRAADGRLDAVFVHTAPHPLVLTEAPPKRSTSSSPCSPPIPPGARRASTPRTPPPRPSQRPGTRAPAPRSASASATASTASVP